MKCTNCGAELTGKFCTECGTPAPEEVKTESSQDSSSAPKGWGDFATDTPVDTTAPTESTENSYQSEAPAAPVEYQNPFDAQQSQNNTQPVQNNSNANYQTSYGQQFSNQPNQSYAGQQFSNQPQNGTPNGKKTMSGGKIAVIVISVILGLIIILGIIIGVVACNFIKNSKGFLNSAISSINEYGEFEFSYNSDDYASSNYSNSNNSYYDEFENTSKLDKHSNLYYADTDGGVKITGYGYNSDDTASTLTVEIPEEIDHKSVVEIETLGIYANSEYIKVVIPSSVKTIDWYAFGFNKNIDEVEIKDGVQTIEYGAFEDCSELIKITIPASVQSLDGCGLGMRYDENYDKVKMDDFVMYGKKGSAAEAYAKENNLIFKEN